MNKNIKALIVCGGKIESRFGKDYIDQNEFKVIIGVDSGLEFLHQHQLVPTHIVGDFDSVAKESLDFFKKSSEIVWKVLTPEKDATDTEEAVQWALELGAAEIHLLGATGTRIDHLLGNIQVLKLALEHNVSAYIVDSHNKIELLNQQYTLEKAKQFGDFVSVLPFTSEVEGVTLTGVKYPLNNYLLTKNNALGVSNEIVEEKMNIDIKNGIVIFIQSRD